MSLKIFILALDGTTGINHIGKHHTRAAKNIIRQYDPVVDGYVVLDSDVVAENGISSYIDVLAKYATFPNLGAGHHMYPVPNFGPCSNVHGLVNDGGFVDKYIVHVFAHNYTLYILQSIPMLKYASYVV
jgi:hypothetical protein